MVYILYLQSLQKGNPNGFNYDGYLLIINFLAITFDPHKVTPYSYGSCGNGNLMAWYNGQGLKLTTYEKTQGPDLIKFMIRRANYNTTQKLHVCVSMCAHKSEVMNLNINIKWD